MADPPKYQGRYPEPFEIRPTKKSNETLAERADARYTIEKRIGPMDLPGAMEEKAALSEGACDGQVCWVPRGGPLQGRLSAASVFVR